MAGALTEFGRKSTGYKVGVFVAAGVLFGLLYYQFAYKKTKRELEGARQNNKAAVDSAVKLDADWKKYQELLKEADKLNRELAENQKALPTEAELPAFFDTLGRKVSEAGVSVKRWDYLKEVPTETFIKVPLDIEVTGTFYQIKRFLASLIERDPVPVIGPDGQPQTEARERIVTIENFQLIDPKGKNRELVVTARFLASTFRQEIAQADEPAKPGQPGAAAKPGTGSAGSGSAGSGSAAGSGAGSALPPAATPAGAKARVEDSMQKDQTRSDDKLKGGVP